MENVVTKGSVCVQVNDDLGHFFQTGKGLRQGDPVSPILFNMVVDVLAVLIERAKSQGFLNGVVPHLVEDGMSVLQYADDTILFINDDLERAKGLKLVLGAFEKLSGLKINFHKSELFCFGDARDKTEKYVQLFGCKEGEFPFRYLGIPMSPKRLSNRD
jgi:hypothetical protein